MFRGTVLEADPVFRRSKRVPGSKMLVLVRINERQTVPLRYTGGLYMWEIGFPGRGSLVCRKP